MLNHPVTSKEFTMPFAVAVRIIRAMFASLDQLEFFGAIKPISDFPSAYMRTLILGDLDSMPADTTKPTVSTVAGLAYAVAQVERGGDLDRVQTEAVAVATGWLNTHVALID